MAAIDKIYGTNEQYDELYTWMDANYPSYLPYFYPKDGYTSDNRPIANLPCSGDYLLAKYCPIQWVLNALKEQYGGKLPALKKSEVYFINKIVPHVYSHIADGAYGARYEYFVRPNSDIIWEFFGNNHMRETYLTVSDLV